MYNQEKLEMRASLGDHAAILELVSQGLDLLIVEKELIEILDALIEEAN